MTAVAPSSVEVESLSHTSAPPPAGVPQAVAVFATVPASMSAWVIVWKATQLVEALGASRGSSRGVFQWPKAEW